MQTILELILEVILRKLIISKTAFYDPFKNLYIYIFFLICIILRVVQVMKVLNDRFRTAKQCSIISQKSVALPLLDMWPGGVHEVFSIILPLYSAYAHYFITNLEKNIIHF